MRLKRDVLFASVLESSIHLRPHIIVITVAKRSQREYTLLIAVGAVGKLMSRSRRLRRKHMTMPINVCS